MYDFVLSKNTFRLPVLNKCILSGSLCVHGDSSKHSPEENGNCTKCVIPLVMREKAELVLQERIKNGIF